MVFTASRGLKSSWKTENRLHFLNRKLKAMERVKNEMPELRSITDLTDIPMKLTSWGKRFPAERQIWPKCSFLGRSYQISVISDSMLEIWHSLLCEMPHLWFFILGCYHHIRKRKILQQGTNKSHDHMICMNVHMNDFVISPEPWLNKRTFWWWNKTGMHRNEDD